jgi:hypothetical protein
MSHANPLGTSLALFSQRQVANLVNVPQCWRCYEQAVDRLGVGKIYGAAAGQQLTTLLKEHISIAVDLVKAAKAGDKAGQQAADAKWQQNGTAIADFLSKANPHLPRATLVELMKGHLLTTTTEVVARLNKKWDDDVRAFDEVYRHILMMSDALSDGIVKQFPQKFSS